MKDKLIAKNIVIYNIQGIILPNETNRVDFYNKNNCLAFLSSSIEELAEEADRREALSRFVLSKTFLNQGETVESMMEEVRKEKSKHNSGLYLMISIEREFYADTSKRVENDDYIVVYDVVDNKAIKDENKELINKITTLFCIANPNPVTLSLRTNSVYYSLGEKLLYNFNIIGNAATVIISKRVDTSYIESFQAKFNGLMGKKISKRLENSYTRLLKEKDGFRYFQFAWLALEILINSAFESYKKEFYADILANESEIKVRFYKRIQDVMEGKYNIKDKFNVICSLLSDAPIEDLRKFEIYKKLRDGFSHGEDIKEDVLPNQELKEFLERYLRLVFEK